MINEFEQNLIEFHEAYGAVVERAPVAEHPQTVRDLREKLIEEEFIELKDALDDKDVLQICKEGADLLYVVLGTMVSYGIPITEVFREVHASNMSKLGDNGKPIYRKDGKVLKGPNYREADIQKVLSEIDFDKRDRS